MTTRVTTSVLLIPELLKAIFLHIDMATLLASCLRVTKLWSSLIIKSKSLQQALFFLSTPVLNHSYPSRPILPADDNYPFSWIAIESLNGEGSATFNNQSCKSEQWDFTSSKEHKTRPVLNPLLIKKFGDCFFPVHETPKYYRNANSLYKPPWTSTKPRLKTGLTSIDKACIANKFKPQPLGIIGTKIREVLDRRRFTHKGASWRRMFVSNPPPKLLGYSSDETGGNQAIPSRIWQSDCCQSSKPSNQSEARCGQHAYCLENLSTDGRLNMKMRADSKPRTFSIPSPIRLRMGDFYDLTIHQILHDPLEPTAPTWSCITWGAPINPCFWSKMQKQIEIGRIEKVVVAVEFLRDDLWPYIHGSKDNDVRTIERLFKCDEYRQSDVGIIEKSTECSGRPGLDWDTCGFLP